MDVLELSQQVVERYRRYLLTTFEFRDPVLRASFEEALNRESLSRGPYIEATPPFRRGRTPRELLGELFQGEEPPDEGFLQALFGNRPLYRHQEEAIRRTVRGQNVVVATGTGSGKTEAFLYPILLHLYREHRRGELGPGVRALILYPMNALAHDQRERLGELCWRLEEFGSSFHFTFGQYIGETPEDERDARRQAKEHQERGLPRELVFRRKMRETPPHILLTNYSMLEYLLLRPDDSPLFDNGQARWWTFLVLDEAHQYRGTKGTEMALLIRRLKRRLREGGRSGPFRCIATSATLLGEEGDKAAVARFAEELFSEPFSEDNVVLSDLEPVEEPESAVALNIEDYSTLADALKGDMTSKASERLGRLSLRVGYPLLAATETPVAVGGANGGEEAWATWLGGLLQRDRRAVRLRRELGTRVCEAGELADLIFPDAPSAERGAALARLLRLLVWARDPRTGTPLLAVRYHLFLRSLEGVFVRYQPEKRVLLERAKGEDAEEGTVFEVALCRECGQHYFIGQLRDERWTEAVRDPSREDFGVRYLRPLENESDEDVQGEVRLLCVRCGSMGGPRLTPPPCSHPDADLLRVVLEPAHEDETRADQLKRCSACGYTAGGRDPVSEVIYGDEGPHAVIATTLHQHLPQKRKRVLAFADGRQHAAFFAWYLEGSYRDVLDRRLMLEAARRLAPAAGPEGLSLPDLAAELRGLLQERRVLPAAASELELRREAWRILYQEFLTEEARISLEGVGLVRWTVKLPDWIEISVVLTRSPWNLREEEAQALLLYLLDTMRREKAVELETEEGVTINWSDLGATTAPMRVRLGKPRRNQGVRDWAGPQGRRVRFLCRLLMERGVPEREAPSLAVKTLQAIWGALNVGDERAPSAAERLLLPVKDAKRLNPRWWRLMPLYPEDLVYRCDTCGRLQSLSVGGLCPRFNCRGRLQPVTVRDLPPDHYRSLYQEELPGPLRVEEHTAQLSYEKAREYQRDFKAGRINVLSCSTTFELGVDLGELDVVFLRNVPPEPFNYAQRVGRAGRRREPGFALTYCRRSSHDLYHFTNPERMLQGRIRPPTLSLRNEKLLLRHMMAAVLSAFFRTHRERFRSVEALLGNWERPTALLALSEFLQNDREALEEALREILLAEAASSLGLSDGSWIHRLADPEGQLALAVAEAASDYQMAKTLEEDAAARGDYSTARWAQARAWTIANEDALSFLSRKAVIPKYGFPVDVVELDTHRAASAGAREATDVALQRDLQIAVSEFAPSAEVIANKKVWKSHGLKKVLERTWPINFYKLCSRHNTFVQWEQGTEERALPCGCAGRPRSYVVPRFGFISERKKPKEPQGRPLRLFSTRPYFAGGVGPPPGQLILPQGANPPLLTLTKASPGRMVVLCEGRWGSGFYVCLECGAGDRKVIPSHITPYGHPCSGKLENFSLGHEFITDVLRLEFHLVPSGLAAQTAQKDPLGFAYSLAYALVEAAAVRLEVPPTDLNAVVAYEEERLILPILLYDDVPGGAGLVARLEEEILLRRCLELARERVAGACGCGEFASCYGCLRSYRNQFLHERLRRGPVQAYLQELLSRWPEG
jgi:ATP-dependent helicase YprA (DUF1998 family)